MLFRARRRHCVAPRSANAVPAWALSLVRAFVLLAIALLPVQMKAGASEAHPHSLLQLVVDARDGPIDHHQAHEREPEDHSACQAGSDLPSVGETGRAGGSITVVSASMILMFIPAFSALEVWPVAQPWRGWLPELESPPPRRLRV